MMMQVQQATCHDFPKTGNAPLRVLLLDDSNFDRARIRRMTHRTGIPIELDEVDCIEAMDTAASRSSYDLVLVDYRLPDGDGLAALDRLRNTPLNRDAGTIMITGNAALDTAVQAMRRGCQDFLSKDGMTVEELHEALRNAIWAAERRRQMALIEAGLHERIRDGVMQALGDASMLRRLAAAFAEHSARSVRSEPWGELAAEEMAELVEALMREDDFVFH